MIPNTMLAILINDKSEIKFASTLNLEETTEQTL
jgi:hypothetical protein